MTTTLRQRWAHRARVVEAMSLLSGFGLAQRLLPMPMWSGALGKPAEVPPEWRGRRIDELPTRAATPTERNTVLAVRRASRALPWTPTCLAEAATGQVLLRQAGGAGLVVVGLKAGQDSPENTWQAHAWLLGKEGALTGGPASTGFTATNVYEAQKGPGSLGVTLPTPWTPPERDIPSDIPETGT